jgi:DUF4097 and DUF4098 domain-containing protein YvlB
MQTFETPSPIAATIDVVRGDVQIRAGELGTTTVTVAPADGASDDDRRAAEQTRVEYANGRLLVKTPKLRSYLPRSSGGAIQLAIELPEGSQVQARAALADFSADGQLGDCRIKTGMGSIRIQEGETLNLNAGIGDIAVGRATGHAEVTAGAGDVRLGTLVASAVVKNSNGDTHVGVAGGDLRVNAANGDIDIDVAQGGVIAKSANGDVRLGEAQPRSSVVLETSLGDVEVGIPDGTAAWLDVRAAAGKVRNALEAAREPETSVESIEVRARTTAGDVVITRPR